MPRHYRMTRARRWGLMALAAVLVSAAGPAAASVRVLSLDQCADQFVLALSPRAEIVGLSTRAENPDSRLRRLATGLPRRRVDLESLLAARPDVVVRYWSGDLRLETALEARGVRVVTIDEASDFDGVRRNVRTIAHALGRDAAGEAVIADMDRRLAASAGAWKGRTALYLTPSGVTAGRGTLVDAILRAAGMRNAETRVGYRTVSFEQLALDPPPAVVLGFFDTFQLAGDSWAPGRHGLMQSLERTRTVARLPGSMLGCPEPGAAEAVGLLAASAPR